MSEPTAFDKYWNALKAKNRGLEIGSARMTMTVVSFREELRKAFYKGLAAEKVAETFVEKMLKATRNA